MMQNDNVKRGMPTDDEIARISNPDVRDAIRRAKIASEQFENFRERLDRLEANARERLDRLEVEANASCRIVH